MLFNSYDFLFGFLPLVLLGHHVLSRRVGMRAAWIWLVATSLLFYGWWYAPYLLLLLGSMAGNYTVGRVTADERRGRTVRKGWLTIGVTANLALLGFFKYAGMFDDNVLFLTGIDLPIPRYVLPLAISFFTFQQIAYLVDAYKGLTKAHDPLDYALFVSFFPQLIAGPIVHHGEMIPQFREGRRATHLDRSVGLTLLILGLGKKVLIADTFGVHADQMFRVVGDGHAPTVINAWQGLLSYMMQIYFDFSGYSDMAIGLSRMFGITLPVNFDAPYRSDSMIDFWKRWHITLSRFLKDYLYIPLGGSRKGSVRRYANLMITMLLGGLWHGANWTFVAWGGVNGAFLLVNHGWINLWKGKPPRSRLWKVSARVITLLCVLYGYVFFRAEDFGDAIAIHQALIGITPSGLGKATGWLPVQLLFMFAFTQLAPTSQRWMEKFEPVLIQWDDRIRWREGLTWQPTFGWGLLIGLLGLLCLPFLERAAPFVYWQF